MGQLALAAKITHVPSMYLSEFPGPNFGCRDAAINGHKEIDRRCRALGVDTIVVFDVHWQVNSEYHINCGPKFEGIYTSNELPHFIKNMPYAYPGNPKLGHLIADVANEMGVIQLPQLILVDDKGAVVSTNLQPAELGAELKKLITSEVAKR